MIARAGGFSVVRRVAALVAATLISSVTVLAVGVETASASPTVTDIEAGVYHSCEVLSSGTAKCWGQNGTGELGDGTTAQQSLPVAVLDETGTAPLANITQIAVGGFSCALLTDTSVRCWGGNDLGSLGIGTTSGPQSCGPASCSTLPVAVHDPSGVGLLTGVTQIAVGGASACALQSDTTVVCWGNNTANEVGSGTGNLTEPLPTLVKDASGTTTITGVSRISSGGRETCAVLADTSAWCWGLLGTGLVKDFAGATLSGIARIGTGSDHSCAVLVDGSVRCWGSNTHGQLGNGTTVNSNARAVTVRLAVSNLPLNGVASVATGALHSCALLLNGGVDCWGDNGYENLGVQSTYGPDLCSSFLCSTTPLPVQNSAGTALLTGATALSATGGYHTCAVLNDGTGRCWGQDTYSELGDGSVRNSCRPQAVGVVAPVPLLPTPPTSVSATAGDRSATVTWTTPPFDCRAPLLAMNVIASPGGNVGQVSSFRDGESVVFSTNQLTSGTTYSFRITATNDIGTGSASPPSNAVTTVGPPDPPTAVTVVGGRRQATVSWVTPVRENGATLTGYAVSQYLNGFIDNTIVFPSTATSETVTGLTDGRAYTFSVASINSYGIGLDSAHTAPVTIGAPGAPGSPVATAGNGQATVHWLAPAGNSAAITGYTVTPYLAGVAQAPHPFASLATTQIISGLTNSKTYAFKVTATNSLGTGSLSAATAPITIGTPTAPTAVGAKTGNGAAVVHWSAPVTTNGAPVNGYVVRPYLAGVAQAARTFNSAATTQTVSGLSNGGKYTFTVAARNANGTGPASTAGPSITVGVPDPAVVTAVGASTQATVSWAAVANNGSAVTSYVVRTYLGSVIQTAKTHLLTCSPQPCAPARTWTVTGLTSGATYRFEVTATNANGSGASGSTTIEVGAPTPPGAPTAVHAVAGPASAVVSWATPANGSATITAFVITPYKAGVVQPTITVAGTATARSITGLTSGASYTFTVAARNAAGTSAPSALSTAVVPT